LGFRIRLESGALDRDCTKPGLRSSIRGRAPAIGWHRLHKHTRSMHRCRR
jgi:hypothetical protein